MKIDLGCGLGKREGYTGVDCYEAEGIDVVTDLTKTLPFEDGSVEAISTSHFLEHVTDNQVMDILAECYRVSAPGAVLEIIVPNLPRVLEDFLAAEWGNKWKWNIMTIFGNQESEGQFHKTGFDGYKLSGMVEFVGFKDVTVEEVYTHSQPCLYLKATK